MVYRALEGSTLLEQQVAQDFDGIYLQLHPEPGSGRRPRLDDKAPCCSGLP